MVVYVTLVASENTLLQRSPIANVKGEKIEKVFNESQGSTEKKRSLLLAIIQFAHSK